MWYILEWQKLIKYGLLKILMYIVINNKISYMIRC